jgi:hypothetical protein
MQTVEVPKFTIIDVTATATAACNLLQWNPQPDPTCTYLPTKIDLSAKVTGVPGLLPSSVNAERAIGMNMLPFLFVSRLTIP